MQTAEKEKFLGLLKKISQGSILTLAIFGAAFIYNKDDYFIKTLLYETLPNASIENEMRTLFTIKNTNKSANKSADNNTDKTNNTNPKINGELSTSVPEDETDRDSIIVSNKVIGTGDVIFQDESKYALPETISQEEIFTRNNVDKLRDLEYLSSKFYIQENTRVDEADFNVDKFLETDLKIDTLIAGPKILIFHTHIHEMYADSNPDRLEDGVYGVGQALEEALEVKYNIDVLHHKGIYDYSDGRVVISASYERMEPDIKKILEENPTIEVVIDIHRDGLRDESRKLLTNINGVDTAQIMFVNGMTKILKDDTLTSIDSLPNSNLATNLAFSFNMQLTANALYPNFTRKVYLKPYRYSLHLAPKTLLTEVGAQTNTMREARAAAEPLAEILANVILGN
jgi:stage II sporulation protein P